MGGLNKALARKVREMEKLKRAAGMISSRTNLDETLQGILSIGLDMTAAQYAALKCTIKIVTFWFPRLWRAAKLTLATSRLYP